MTREIQVFGDWQALGGPQQIGRLRADRVHGRETFSFEYDRAWLESNNTLILDPELLFFEGSQYIGDRKKPNFGLFLDSSPDRWGRMIMKRREAMLARAGQREVQTLLESDFLLGVHDEQRMGGLRFKEEIAGDFLSNYDGHNAPPWARLRELEHAAWQIQASDAGDSPELREWINLLMAPGSSIGGARPKAGVCDEQENLWIAKFPGRGDEIDVGAWEMVVHTLAVTAGLDIAESRVERFGRPHHTFLTRRFDRVVEGSERKRRHFASAMTMLGYADGAGHEEGASYLELVEFLIRHGADVNNDLPELWRRIVFSICVTNTDDHLRNHGFMLEETGWKLSPAYDINPNPAGTGLHLNISEHDNSLNLDLARSVAKFFRVDQNTAEDTIERVIESVQRWRAVAESRGITRAEQDSMKPAFRV
ncbi:MAG TPA: HipA domain-containing protein [Planctomycetaceae bacterium]|nr:HipA domain-containing protein [Planctomycetaceae bacterium]